MVYLNLSQLSIVLNIRKHTLYPHFVDRDNKNKHYKIDIDKFLIEHKVYDFDFDFEINKSTFLDLFITEINDEFLTTAQVKNSLKITDYELYKLRQKHLKFVPINKTRYKYNLSSLKVYAFKKNIILNTLNLTFSKEFYTPTEFRKILEEQHNIKISTKSLYRYIYDYNLVPAIKVFGSLRLPINEINSRVIPNVSTIFEKIIKKNMSKK